MQFSELIKAIKPDGDGWLAPVPDSWLQGRTAFGGLQVALALWAMRRAVPEEIPLRTLQATFVAPVAAGTVRLAAQTLRRGRNVTQAEGRLLGSDGQTLCLVVGVFGTRRSSAVALSPAPPRVDAVDRRSLRYRAGGPAPAFVQHFAMDWLQGPFPYSGAASADAVVEVGLHDADSTSELHLPLLGDSLPPVAAALLKDVVAVSSMTWMLELLADRWDHQPLSGWRFDTAVTSANDGYSSQSVMIWAPDGTPAALSRQTVTLFG